MNTTDQRFGNPEIKLDKMTIIERFDGMYEFNNLKIGEVTMVHVHCSIKVNQSETLKFPSSRSFHP